MKRYRAAYRLSLLTAIATFALIALGGMVHNTGSSLACPDWPLCYGEWLPPMTGGILYEHSHRLLGAAVGLGIIGLVGLLWHASPGVGRGLRWTLIGLMILFSLVGGAMLLPQFTQPWMTTVLSGALLGLGLLGAACLGLRADPAGPNLSLKSIGLLALVLLQGMLGGTTVKYQLPMLISTAHLALSMIVLLALIYLARAAWVRSLKPGAAGRTLVVASAEGARGAFALLAIATALVYAQIVLGALVRHTLSSEAAGWGLANALVGLDYATGHHSLWPSAAPAQLNVLHRYLALLVGVLVVLTSLRSRQLLGREFARGRKLAFALPIVLVLAQILAGITMLAAWNLAAYPALGLSDTATGVIQIALRTLHLTLGAALLASLYHLLTLAGQAARVTAPAPAQAPEGGGLGRAVEA